MTPSPNSIPLPIMPEQDGGIENSGPLAIRSGATSDRTPGFRLPVHCLRADEKTTYLSDTSP